MPSSSMNFKRDESSNGLDEPKKEENDSKIKEQSSFGLMDLISILSCEDNVSVKSEPPELLSLT